MPRAYYNEIDPDAAAVIRELIKEEVLTDGEVDERDIRDVEPADLVGFDRIHLFGGFGIWDYALTRARWPDDRTVLTGSCPCPPFSTAGKTKACPDCGAENCVPHVGRTGFFVCVDCSAEWLADARHLWPEMFRLVAFRRPDAILGEQVSSADGRTWLAGVRASLEILGYAVGASDICSAGVGGADIRQRLYFVADSVRDRVESTARGGLGTETAVDGQDRGLPRERLRPGIKGSSSILADSDGGNSGAERPQRSGEQRQFEKDGGISVLAEPSVIGRRGRCDGDSARDGGQIQVKGRGSSGGLDDSADGRPAFEEPESSLRIRSDVGELGDAEYARHDRPQEEPAIESVNVQKRRLSDGTGQSDFVGVTIGPRSQRLRGDGDDRNESGRIGTEAIRSTAAPSIPSWRNAEWIYCTDEQYRPVPVVPESIVLLLSDDDSRSLGLVRITSASGEEKTVVWPLIAQGEARQMRLRGFGNAINAEVATKFIESYLDVLKEGK